MRLIVLIIPINASNRSRKKGMNMKTIKIVLCLVLILGALLLLSSCATKTPLSTDNIDEMVGMWLSVIFLPDGLKWWWLIIAFFIFRFFDIIKPPPVNKSQKIPRGWGVMIDDVLAGFYTNLF